jgi:hypothetical protein
MNNFVKIWVVDYYDSDGESQAMGYFTTLEGAQKYVWDALNDPDGIYDATSDFRIDWHNLDQGYDQ